MDKKATNDEPRAESRVSSARKRIAARIRRAFTRFRAAFGMVAMQQPTADPGEMSVHERDG